MEVILHKKNGKKTKFNWYTLRKDLSMKNVWGLFNRKSNPKYKCEARYDNPVINYSSDLKLVNLNLKIV